MPSTQITSTPQAIVPAEQLLASARADGTTATITFSSIPQDTYNHLLVVVNARTTLTGGSPTQHCYINPNADATASHYEFQEVRGIGATPAGVELVDFEGFAAVALPDDGPANGLGYGAAIIYGYRQTTFHKQITGIMGSRWTAITGGMGALWMTSIWLSTAAITSVNLVAEGGVWKTGSVFRLYGIR